MKRFVLSCLVLAMVAGPTAWAGGEASEEGLDWYWGFSIGAVANVSGYYSEGEHFATGNPSLGLKIGFKLSDEILLSNEFHIAAPLFALVLIDDFVVRYFPVQENGFYLIGGLGYGLFGVPLPRDRADDVFHGVDTRFGLGYDGSFGETFHLGVELASSTIFTSDFFMTNVFLMMTFSWY